MRTPITVDDEGWAIPAIPDVYSIDTSKWTDEDWALWAEPAVPRIPTPAVPDERTLFGMGAQGWTWVLCFAVTAAVWVTIYALKELALAIGG